MTTKRMNQTRKRRIRLRRIKNILKYGLGKGARERKDRAKLKAREDAFASDLWQKGDDKWARRYASYDDYLAHQSAKLDRIGDRLQEEIDKDLQEFLERFRNCPWLGNGNNVLCLGARLGTEVRALHALGHFAVGIDLNPGKDNKYVLPGDFHNIAFADATVDIAYTNCLDHAFEAKRVAEEVHRILKPGGLFIADVLDGVEEGYIPGEFEAISWATAKKFIDQLAKDGGFEQVDVIELGKMRKGSYSQGILKKPLA